MTVVQGDGAVVGDGVETDFFGVHGVADTDVLSPAECEHLQENECHNLYDFKLKYSKNKEKPSTRHNEKPQICSNLYLSTGTGLSGEVTESQDCCQATDHCSRTAFL